MLASEGPGIYVVTRDKTVFQVQQKVQFVPILGSRVPILGPMGVSFYRMLS
jgi:hypothetical protein